MIAYIVRFKGRLLNHWDDIRNSYWFLPSVMALGSVILSYVTLLIDRHTIVEETFGKDWTYTGSAEGARSVLAIIASSMIGIAGVVFSITTVTLTLASSQFGPRILRNFMSDKPNQIVLGTFTATFLYCLLILRQTHGTDEDVGYEMFIPQLSMTVAVVFAIASLGVLIYFIHHVAASIQTPNVVAGIGQEFGRVVEDLYPDEIGKGHPPAQHQNMQTELPVRFREESTEFRATSSGYLRRVELSNILGYAAKHDMVIQVEREPGAFVSAGDVLMRVWPAGRFDDTARTALGTAVVTGDQRTPAQDVRFPLGQLTEIAVRALSPGVNDPFTAVMCVDWLGDGLRKLVRRTIPSPYLVDEAGKLRVVAERSDFAGLLAAGVDPIRQSGRSQPMVMTRLLSMLAGVAARTSRPEQAAQIVRQAELIRDEALEVVVGSSDHETLRQLCKDVVLAAEVRVSELNG